MFWKFRSQLCQVLANKTFSCQELKNFNLEYWLEQDLKALILDYDGVLAAYSEIELNQRNVRLITSWSKVLGPNGLYILSNKPMPSRIAYFKEKFPDINFVVVALPKPHPEGIEYIISKSGLPAKSLLIVDDRLGTGILAGVMSNINVCYITKPLKNFKLNLLAECFFCTLRAIERCCLRIYMLKNTKI